jgi:hypothetical protein
MKLEEALIHMPDSHGIPEIPVKEISELLDTVSKKLPDLISNLLRTIYSQEAGSEMGKAVGSLYKELLASDIPQDVALKMATDYMISLKDILKHASSFQSTSTSS